MTAEARLIGIDVGSTTVKTVAIDAVSRRLLWSRYERHGGRQAETLVKQLEALEAVLPSLEGARVFVTGSGGGPLCNLLGALFIQEVNAVVMAVDELHPDAGSVVELGGQDAKIIIYRRDPVSGERRAEPSMNDKCASGTGAIIDKCLVKIGLNHREAADIGWRGDRLHPVAAKCGVFAETDIVNLVKSGIAKDEVFCSLADAIVGQNLSVLSRGSTLPHKVVLLGGPNLHLPVLRDCWRQRIGETWQARAHDHPRDIPIEELVFVPEHAHLYAAIGACLYGLGRPAAEGVYRGPSQLRDHIAGDRRALIRQRSGPPLVGSTAERDAFTARYELPRFVPARLRRGETVRGYIGFDGGSTSSKAVLIDTRGEVLFKTYRLSGGNPLDDATALLGEIEDYIEARGARLDILGLGTTGYAGEMLKDVLQADVQIVETIAHVNAALHYFEAVDVICDVGGQDIKVLFLADKQVRDYRLSNQCSAGNGMLLQAMADQFGISMERYADHAFNAEISPEFGYGCAVFLDADRVNFQKEGYSRDELLAGLARVLPKNIWQYIVQAPRLAAFGRRFVLQGGTQLNLAALKAQYDYIRERVPDAEILLHPHPGEAGAIGAALEARALQTRAHPRKEKHSRFIGLANLGGLHFTTRNDAGTACRLCANGCKRTFIDVTSTTGEERRIVTGQSCERGSGETPPSPRELALERRRQKQRCPNLVAYETKLAFRPLPKIVADDDHRRQTADDLLAAYDRRHTAGDGVRQRRRRLRIGLPRVLNLYSTAPLWRTFFETLGIPAASIVFSETTSAELWSAGGIYGANDPCFPAKVAQAHIHNLINVKHAAEPLDYIFFPAITHVPTFVRHVMDAATCPVVAGTPMVQRAAFTKETDFFARAGIDYVAPAVTLIEPHFFIRQMFEAWGPRLEASESEIAGAVAAGLAALEHFDAEMERRGLALLDQLESERRVGVLLLGRPYHNDPGINHRIPEELTARGFPVLSVRSLPKDPEWLRRWFALDADADADASLSVDDVWPENYAANSVQKVWAAKFAVRHPNLAVLDLSSFKCGQDALTYGLIDAIVAGTRTPYLAVHDIDANRPAGTLRIRIETFVHALRRFEARLAEISDSETASNLLRRRLIGERQQAVLQHLLAGSGEAAREFDRQYAAFREGADEPFVEEVGE